MKQYILIISIFISNILSGQELKKGLIMPSEDFEECCIYIPKSGLSIYESPDSEIVGKLTLGSPDNSNDVYSATIKIGNTQEKIEFSNLHMVGYEVFALIYIDRVHQFLKIKRGYWLSMDELKSKGLLTTSWMDYLIAKENIMGWYANDPGLNLRAEPNVKAKIIETLKGDLWEITPTNEVQGLWCKVKVKEYKNHPCSGEDDQIIRELIGWVKLLADDQTPNVWNYAKGC
ncbi:SH3 domain-containing protein [Marivirga tractuosa]|uniref:SH3 domain-containing protein n=1 Tax=Marivirga tractuosa TaxID=1006 RepID=UPI0035CF2ABA